MVRVSALRARVRAHVCNMGSEHHVTCLLQVHLFRLYIDFDHITTRRSTILVPKIFALVWHSSIRRRCRDGPTQHADSHAHPGRASDHCASARRLHASMDIARTRRYVRTTLPPASRSLLRTRNAALSAAVSMLMSVAAATGPSLRRIAGTSSATSECVQVAAVRSALSGGARPSVSGTWTYSLGQNPTL